MNEYLNFNIQLTSRSIQTTSFESVLVHKFRFD